MKPSPNLNLFDALALGLIDSPASNVHHASDRWHWFADLYADRTWGVVAAIPEFPRLVADQIAGVCRITAMRAATAEQWQVIKEIATTGRATARSQSLELAWSAVLDTCIDAHNHLDGIDFGGLEAILGVFDAILHEHEASTALAFLNDAYTTWGRRLALHDSHDRRAA